MSHDCCHGKGHELEQVAHHKDIRRVLVIVLMLNALMFVLEFGAGLVARYRLAESQAHAAVEPLLAELQAAATGNRDG